MDIKDQVKNVAAQGRYGDTMLLHVNPIEVEALAKTMPITVNPETGQPEAFLPLLAMAAPLIGSLAGPALFSALGATTLSPLIASALGAGLAQTAATGDVKKGLIAGLTGYGFGKLFQGISGAGAAKDATAVSKDILAGGGTDATNLIKEGLLGMPNTDPKLLTTATQAAKDATLQGLGEAGKGAVFSTSPTGSLQYTLPGGGGLDFTNATSGMFTGQTPMPTIPSGPQTALFQPADFATAGIDVTAPSLLSPAGQTYATNVLASQANQAEFARAIGEATGQLTKDAFGLPMSQGPGVGQLYSNVPKAFQGEGLMGSLGVLKDAGSGALLPIGAGYGADYAYDMYKGPEGESFEDRMSRERAENFAANPEPNIFYEEGGSTDLGERPKVFSPESILGFSGISPIKSILDGDFKIPAGMFGLAGLAYDYFKNKEARNAYDAKMAAALKKEQAVEPSAMIGQGAMMMGRGGVIKTPEKKPEGKAPERIVARRTRQIPDGFRPGIDPEFMYFETPLNPSAAEVMGTATSKRPSIPPLMSTNTMSYGIPGVIDPYKAFNNQIVSPMTTPVMTGQQMLTPVDTPTVPVAESVTPTLLPDLTNLVNLGLMDGSALIPNYGEGIGLNKGGDTDKKLPNKGLEALDKVAPEVVERMGFQEGDQTEIKPTMAQMQEAIPTDTANQMIDDPLTAELINYLLGKSFDDSVVERFTSKYGANAFAAVRDRALKTLVPNAQTTGKIEGSDNGGMADDIYGSMGNEKIAVSQGEFVLPADVVSGLGDGDTDSGSKELYAMMDRVRQKRTGKTEQPKPVNPRELLPA
jgi:hypothetical protein